MFTLYIKALFLMICGLQLHAAFHHDHSCPADLDAALSPSKEYPQNLTTQTTCSQTNPDERQLPNCFFPAREDHLGRRYSLPTYVALNTASSDGEKPFLYQEHAGLSPEMFSLLERIRNIEQREQSLCHALGKETKKTNDAVRKTQEITNQEDRTFARRALIEKHKCCFASYDNTCEMLSLAKSHLKKKFALERTAFLIKKTALNTPNDHVKAVLETLLTSEAWSLALSITMDDSLLEAFSRGFVHSIPEAFQQECAVCILSGVLNASLWEARLVTGNTIDILAYTTILLLDCIKSYYTFSAEDDEGAYHHNTDHTLAQCSALGKKCFETFTKELKEKGIVLQYKKENRTS